jgi:putative tryptophan/tyrosine transport system substrate-binding protein
MNRRPVVAAVAASSMGTWCAPLFAQSRRRPRLGCLSNLPVTDPVQWKWFYYGMLQLGWEMGVNLEVDWRYAMNERQKYHADARHFVAAGVDVLFAIGPDAVDAAFQATRTIPIVIISAAALEPGYAQSLARPTGNVTGVVSQVLDLVGKASDLLHGLQPDLRRIGVVHQAGDVLSERWLAAWRGAARAQVAIVPLPFPDPPSDVAPVLAAAGREQVQALVTEGPTPLLLGSGFDRLRAWTTANKVLTFSTSKLRGEHLLSFGPDPVDMRRIALSQIDRILRGAKPGTMPIVQADRFELVVNLRIARAMGLAIPRAVLLQAKEVIE